MICQGFILEDVKETIWITTQKPENLDLVKKLDVVCRNKKREGPQNITVDYASEKSQGQ